MLGPILFCAEILGSSAEILSSSAEVLRSAPAMFSSDLSSCAPMLRSRILVLRHEIADGSGYTSLDRL